MESDKLLVQCADCAARIRVPAQAAGKRVRCPKCRAVISVPDSATVTARAESAGE